MCTHNLGFFFGPGLPLSLIGALGSMDGGALLRPVTAAPPLFFLPSTLGGASELGSAASVLVGGMGVALESDVLSTVSDGCADGDASALMACGLGGGVAAGYCARLSGDRRSVTILLFLAIFAVDLVVVAVVDIYGDADDGGWGVGDGRRRVFGSVAKKAVYLSLLLTRCAGVYNIRSVFA